MLASLLAAALLAAQIPVQPGDDFEAIVANAQPGDEIIFAAGDYVTTGYWGVNLQGTAAAPIVVRAAAGETVTLVGNPSQNTIDISGSYYTFAGFRVQGGSHGVRVGNSSHASFEDLEIFATGDVGLSCNRPGETYEDITIRRVHVHDTAGTGECFYLGCNDAECTMFDSLVEFNWCHDTFNSSQGDGIELKTGSYGVTIRHNVIHDVQYPGITMYGTLGMPANLVEGNIVWNAGDNGIQTVGEVIVRNNVVVASGNNGIQAKPSQNALPINLTIVHNTVVGAGDACLRGNDWPADNGNLVAANALFCASSYALRLVNAVPGEFVDNGVLGTVEGVMGGTFPLGAELDELVDPASAHVYPREGASLLDAASQSWVMDDFNCLPREVGPDVGAYEFMGAQNPGWVPEPGFKSCAGGVGEEGDSGDSSGDSSGETSDAGTTSEDGGADEVGGSDETGAGAVDDASGCACSSGDAGPPAAGLALLALLGLRRRRAERRAPLA